MALSGALLPSFTPLSPDAAAPPASGDSLGQLAAVEDVVQGQV